MVTIQVKYYILGSRLLIFIIGLLPKKAFNYERRVCISYEFVYKRGAVYVLFV